MQEDEFSGGKVIMVTLEEVEVPGQIILGMLMCSHQIRVRIPDTWLADLKIKNKKFVLVTG